MTHIRNIPYIIQHGITHKNSLNNNQDFIPIGDVTLINNRISKEITVDNGVTGIAQYTIVLGDYIPFYFGVRMPMLYVVQNGGNFVEKSTPPADIIYLACPVKKIIDSDFIYIFSDGHATDRMTTFFDKNMIINLPTIINWEAIKRQYWSGGENLNIKREKQAEFLVKTEIPPDFISDYGCFNISAKEKLIGMGVDANIIKVIPGAYY